MRLGGSYNEAVEATLDPDGSFLFEIHPHGVLKGQLDAEIGTGEGRATRILCVGLRRGGRGDFKLSRE